MLMLLITGCNTTNNPNPVEEPQNDTPLHNNEPDLDENDRSNMEEK